ncbi:hypothetical protein E2C01_071844 [Portunus trituberculatus]|uniref:Uncharacterized protein n=1 Tax=Portunus trituberculatus TaxID=210409 RepID=A0A5B7I0Z7_PORTR|nr:hypothetical protein [Portunus trituberculatus]
MKYHQLLCSSLITAEHRGRKKKVIKVFEEQNRYDVREGERRREVEITHIHAEEEMRPQLTSPLGSGREGRRGIGDWKEK